MLKVTHNNVEVLSSDFVSVEGEADVLIQAIISIKSVIKQDPLSHEKVFFIFLFSRCSVSSVPILCILSTSFDMLEVSVRERDID